MRLFEITTAITPDKFTPGAVARPRDANFGLGDEQEELGSGRYATAFSTPEEPGTVRKIVGPMNEREFREDAYFKYIQMMAKNDRFTSNPYFPRIYDVQVKKFPLEPNDPTTFYDYAYAVDMERLHPITTRADLSPEEARMLGNKMFNDWERIAAEHIKDHTIERDRGKKVNWDQVLISFMYEFFDNSFRPKKKSSTIFKDPHLKQAVLLLRSMLRKSRAEGGPMFFDLHSGNTMIRRGPGGPQLVFTDPVAN